MLYLFFFNDTATTEIYTLSLHDALPISWRACCTRCARIRRSRSACRPRSEEHTSELQSHSDLVCRLLLEKKNTIIHLPPMWPAILTSSSCIRWGGAYRWLGRHRSGE